MQIPVHDLSREKAQRETPEQSCARVRALLKAFKGWVPGDLASSVEFRKASDHMQEHAPAVYVAGLLGKEDPWKRALANVWAHLPPSHRLQVGLLSSRDRKTREHAARIVHDVFAVSLGLWAGWTVPRLGHMSWPVDVKAELVPPTTMKSRAAAEEHAWWNKHVNRNVQQHSGLCPWALRHGLLRKSGKRGSLLMQNVGGEYYSLCPFVATEQTESMASLHHTGMVLNTMQIPRTSSEWIKAMRRANDGATYFGIPMPDYQWPWLVQAYLIVEMRYQGIERLRIDCDWGTDELKDALKPDQCAWLHRWLSSAVASNSLKKLLRALAYDEPLEMLSCFACIFGDNNMMQTPVDRVRRHMQSIVRAHKAHCEAHTWEAHPAHILSAAM